MTLNAMRRGLDIRAAAVAARFGGHIPNGLIATPVFLLLCIITGALVMMTAAADIKAVHRQKLDDVARWRKAAGVALDAANTNIVASPCSSLFQQQLRTIAFWPDGINEFLYMPGTSALCSAAVSSFPTPIEFGRPDISSTEAGIEIWLERDLTPIGIHGLRGSILKKGKFAAVISNVAAAAVLPPWLTSEFVAMKDDGVVLSISGTKNLFTSLRSGADADRTSLKAHISCSDDGLFCVAASIDALSWCSHHVTAMLVCLVILAFSAYLIALVIGKEIRAYFSFKSTMVRNLSCDSIVLTYQPIYDLKEQRIGGVEVLVRYRDLDGTIVYPDKFVGLVSEAGKTIELTRLVMDAAKSELGRHWTFDCDLQVNVNVFPRDIGNPALLEICSSFVAEANPRLKLAVEVVESEAFDHDELSDMVAKLHELGVKIFIDDFGTGYANVENIGTLPVDGIKLERSFAMAPSTSVIGRMFLKVIELLKTTGKPLIVEGVEDLGKLSELSKNGLARYAQGYCIGKPMPVDAFVKLTQTPPALLLDEAA